MFFAIFTFCSRCQKILQRYSQNVPRKPQDSPESLQDPPKTPQDGPKIPARRTQDAPRRTQNAFQARPARTKTAQDTSKPSNMRLRPLQSSIFERLRGQQLRFHVDFSKLPSDSAQAPKHPRWGRRNARSV